MIRAKDTLARAGRSLAREPLAQFLAIGLALFAADRITGKQVDDPRRIVVDAPAYGSIVDIFAESQGRAPTPEEMAPLAERWMMNETLYREARSLGLDQGDEMVRERIMQKLRVLMYNAITVDDPDEATLRAWYELNKNRYTQPARLSFRLARLDGDNEQAVALARRLEAVFRGEVKLAPGEVTVYPFADRPVPALEQVFGKDFVTALEGLPERVWTPIETPEGWQAAYLEEKTPPASATYDEIVGTVAADWREEAYAIAARQAIEALEASYTFDVKPYDPKDFAKRAADAASAAANGETFAP